jgi:transposase-like protein
MFMANHNQDIPVCQNGNCSFFRKERRKHVIKKGINSAGHRQYMCLHCRKYFVETKGTPLYDKRLSKEEIRRICVELVEKKGIRAVERTTGHHRDTITRYLRDIGRHSAEVTNSLVKELGLSEYEVDELWTFVKKNGRKRNAAKKNGPV